MSKQRQSRRAEFRSHVLPVGAETCRSQPHGSCTHPQFGWPPNCPTSCDRRPASVPQLCYLCQAAIAPDTCHHFRKSSMTGTSTGGFCTGISSANVSSAPAGNLWLIISDGAILISEPSLSSWA